MKVKCPFCDRVTDFDTESQPTVTDGSILWDTCQHCGQDISIDCIITTRNEESK